MNEGQLGELLVAGQHGLGPQLVENLPTPWRLRGAPDQDYDFSDQSLIAAIQTSMLLGQPLILAGDPGVGKTTLGGALARRLGLFLHPLVQVKSTTTGLDLFYSFDEVGRFRDATSARAAAGGGEGSERTGLCRYVRFSSLGRAILWSAGPDALVSTGSISSEEITGGAGSDGLLRLGNLFPHEFERLSVDEDGAALRHIVSAPTRSLVLLDELDKAPRDAPNDVLGELEEMSFGIRELDIRIRARADAWPIVLITSNSERNLPDAFLRRCVFHWIEFPTDERLRTIAAIRCGRAYGLKADDPLLKSAVRVFSELRAKVENKRPATAELISFVVALVEFGFSPSDSIEASDPRVAKLFGTLMKTAVDLRGAAPLPSATV